MASKHPDYRFWLLFAALAIGVLVACSSDTTGGGDSGSDGVIADAMTKS
jgi:hypothetical protein